jgi:hypothetical protein
MALPITIPNAFANATTSIPLSQLDSNFTVVANGVNGIGNGTNALSNVSITGGTITTLTTPLSPSNGGTGLTSPGASGNVLVSDGANWKSSATSGLNTAVQGAFKNLKVQVTGNATCNVSCDQIVLYNGTLYSTQSSIAVSINTASTGANGIESGTTLTQATWYYVWLIYNGTTVAGLLSASSTAPTYPSGYTYGARVGCVRTAAASTNLLGTLQYNCRAQYVLGTAATTTLPLIGSGSTWQGVAVGGGTAASPTWGAVSITSFVPLTASQIGIVVMNQYNIGGLAYVFVAPNSNYSGYTGTNPAPVSVFGSTVATMQSGWFNIETSPQTISVYSNNTGGAGICLGWEDNI